MKKTDKSDKTELYCSFCGKSQHEVKKLIAGPWRPGPLARGSVFACSLLYTFAICVKVGSSLLVVHKYVECVL